MNVKLDKIINWTQVIKFHKLQIFFNIEHQRVYYFNV